MEINLEKINAMMNDVKVGGDRLATIYPYRPDGSPHPTMIKLRQEVYLLLWEGLVRNHFNNMYSKDILSFLVLQAVDILKKHQAPATTPIHQRSASKENTEKLKQGRHGVDIDDVIDVVEEKQPSPEDLAEYRDTLKKITSALTDHEKGVLEFILQEGHTVKEIADMIGYSSRTVDAIKRKIKRKIKKLEII